MKTSASSSEDKMKNINDRNFSFSKEYRYQDASPPDATLNFKLLKFYCELLAALERTILGRIFAPLYDHLIRMDENNAARKVYNGNMYGRKRKRDKPWLSLIAGVGQDARQ